MITVNEDQLREILGSTIRDNDTIEHVINQLKMEHQQRVIMEKDYDGFDAIVDIDRDINESFDPGFNPNANKLPYQWDGTVTVVMVYDEDG